MRSTEDIDGSVQPSLQELLGAAERRALLPTGQLARTRSAMAALATFLGRPASAIPGHQGFVIAQMKRMRRAPSTLSKKTLSNYRGELCGLIETVRGRGARSSQPHSASWQAFKAQLRSSADWAPLSRLAGFASTQRIAPPQVDDACVERFVAELETLGEVADPKAHDRRLRRQWNRLRATLPGLGLQELTITAQARPRCTYPEAEFDVRLLADIEDYSAWLADDDPLTANPGRGLRPSTIKTIRHQLFKAATALVQSGRPLETIISLADLVSLENFRALMRHLHKDRPLESTATLHRLGARLVSLARDWIEVDQHVLEKLEGSVKRLAPKIRELGRRTKERLRPFEDERLVGRLLSLPDLLLDDAKRAKPPKKRAMLAQTAIACELLIYAPLRIANLTSLRLEENVKRGGDIWRIHFPPSAVKNGNELSFELPAEAVARVKAAMRLYEQTDGWLFPGRRAGPKISGSLSSQIKKAVESRLGVAFHAHLYRSIAIYLQVKAHGPNGIENGRALIGNRDADTIRRNYAYLADRELTRQAQEEITKQRLSAMRKRR